VLIALPQEKVGRQQSSLCTVSEGGVLRCAVWLTHSQDASGVTGVPNLPRGAEPVVLPRSTAQSLSFPLLLAGSFQSRDA
jgi:hypothetical protein